MKKRILTLFFAICLLAIPMQAWAADSPEVRYSTDGGQSWQESSSLEDAIQASRSNDVQVELLRDITLGSQHSASLGGANHSFTLDGKGYTIKRSASNQQLFAADQNGSTVTLKNVKLDGGAVWNSNDPEKRGNSGIQNSGNAQIFAVRNGAVLVLADGATLQNNSLGSSADGGAVTVENSGKLIVQAGAAIKDNAAKAGGAVVVQAGGNLVIEGGEISGNYAKEGGGALYITGNGEMTGGVIKNNASGDNGGGISVNNYSAQGLFTMNGGEVSGNKSVLGGGGVCAYSGSMIMEGGTIRGNSITGSWGGGMFVYIAYVGIGGSPVISDNTAANGETNNAYLYASKTFDIDPSNPLNDNSKIGVTTGLTPTSGSPVNVTRGNAVDCSKHFFADNSSYQIQNGAGNAVLLAAIQNVAMPFKDVASEDWFAEAVEYVHENQMMNGTADDMFSPYANTTRGMIVTILYRLEKEPTAGGSAFVDVAGNAYYADAVNWAAENEIVKGYGNNKFAPQDLITREQLAAVMYRYAEYKGYDTEASLPLTSFTDAAQVSEYAAAPMQWTVAKGLIKGDETGALLPANFVDRAQTAAVLMRFCENAAK